MTSPTLTWKNRIASSVLRAGFRFQMGSLPTHHDETLDIPSRDQGRSIRAHLYRSKKTSAGPSPVLINAHGSGFLLPLLGTDDEYSLRIAKDTPYSVIDMTYRLAPEHPWPAATDDLKDVVKWAQSQSHQFDSSNIALSGFSAGGNLALSVCSDGSLTDVVRHVFAMYPVAEMSTDPAERRPPDAGGKPIAAWLMRIFDQCYIPPGVDPKTPAISPLFASPQAFPKRVTIITCAYDNLAPTAEALATKLQEIEGKDIVLRRIEKVNHGWDKQPRRPGSLEDHAVEEELSLVVDRLNAA